MKYNKDQLHIVDVLCMLYRMIYVRYIVHLWYHNNIQLYIDKYQQDN